MSPSPWVHRSVMGPQKHENCNRSNRRQSRFDNTPLANERARRPDVAPAQRTHLVVKRRHDEEGVKPAADDDDRAERPAHVLGVKIGDEAGDRRHERKGDEERDAPAVARPPFAEQRRILKLEASWLLDPVHIERGAGEGGRKGQRKRSPDHDGSLLLSGPSSMKWTGKRGVRLTRRMGETRLRKQAMGFAL